jgi:hypothetical protein
MKFNPEITQTIQISMKSSPEKNLKQHESCPEITEQSQSA